MFLKKDIYKALRPTPKPEEFLGMKFRKMSEIDYNDALIYPRFKFLDVDKPQIGTGIFETSDYKKILEIIGDRTLLVGSIFAYNKTSYEITKINIDILDIVIDYSNGHTNYYTGKAIPFHVEIHIYAKKIDK